MRSRVVMATVMLLASGLSGEVRVDSIDDEEIVVVQGDSGELEVVADESWFDALVAVEENIISTVEEDVDVAAEKVQEVAENVMDQVVDTFQDAQQSAETALNKMWDGAAAEATRKKINDSVAQGLNGVVQSLQGTWAYLGITKQGEAFMDAFQKNFDASYSLVADPKISKEEHSLEGGFQIYRRNANDSEKLGGRVATPQQFQQLVIDAVNQTDVPGAGSLGARLIARVQAKEFLRDAFTPLIVSSKE